MIKLSTLILNDKNPRTIDVDNKQKLKDSLNGFMEMLEARPIVIDEFNLVLAGNQKVLCLQELDIKELPNKYVKKIKGWTEAQKKEFIVRDNTHFGSWLDEMFTDEYWKDEPFEDWLDRNHLIIEEPDLDDIVADEKNKPPVMKITFKCVEDLQSAEIEILELVDRKYNGATLSVSAGDI